MADAASIYEKLGVFYLGRDYDMDARQVIPNALTLYDSKDLVTHAVIVGMTGSGKTGLGVGLLEEAAIDNIPAIVVDPKGDLSNLALNFPEMRAEDFRPWVHADDAQRSGKSLDEFATSQAEMWQKGLADWNQDGERIRRIRNSVDISIYTPGSDAGIPISILSSFAAPPPAVLEDADLYRDRISTTATSLLALLDIDADPIKSREHILITTVLDHAWKKGMRLDLGGLIQMVQSPPIKKVGVMDLDSFFPAKDRFELAMSLNNLLASPGFSAWLSGEPLDVDKFLYTPEGKPRISIFSIAHLSDSERMFFMSLLLNQTLGWMRSRSGTTSLRAILYIDEIFGYMPPVANPPSKKPLLTLLKQARAFGLGLVLATQNPVDLDYKGLSNTGTWFLGRLQTERDKERVLDGLEGASSEAGAGFDRAEMAQILSGLGKRVFLLHNVHESSPVTFHTRWALSYLAGPMTRSQIKKLMADRKETAAPDYQSEDVEAAAKELRDPAQEHEPSEQPIPQRPVLDSDIPQVFLPARRAIRPEELIYRPHLLALTKVHFVDTRKGLSADEERALLASLDFGPMGLEWESAETLDMVADDLEMQPYEGADFGELPTEAGNKKSYSTWKKSLSDFLYRSRRYELFRSLKLKEYSHPGESERDFRIRLADEAREVRDELIDKMRDKYASKLRTAEERVRKAEMRLDREKQEASNAKMQSMLSVGASLLGGLLGRKMLSNTNVTRGASAMRGLGRATKQAGDVGRAEEDLMAYQDKFNELEEELQTEIDEISEALDPLNIELDTLQLKPRRTDIDIRHLALAWVPFRRSRDGIVTEIYK